MRTVPLDITREFDMSESMKRGDYVLATKYSDGDPGDHFVVGFYDGKERDRYHVVDAEWMRFRANGFRRCEPITQQEGEWLFKRFRDIESEPFHHSEADEEIIGKSVWDWLEEARRELSTNLPTTP